MLRNGMLFLKAYSKLAFLVYTLSRPLFKQEVHYVQHLILQMRETQLRGHPYLNPLSYSCETAMGFRGRVSFVSRRAASGSAHARVLQTWLAGSMGQWTAGRSRVRRPRPRKCGCNSNRAFPHLPIPKRTHSQLSGPSGMLCLKPAAQILQLLDYHNYQEAYTTNRFPAPGPN